MCNLQKQLLDMIKISCFPSDRDLMEVKVYSVMGPMAFLNKSTVLKIASLKKAEGL